MDDLTKCMEEQNILLNQTIKSQYDGGYYARVLKILNMIFNKNEKSILKIKNITEIILSEKILRKYNRVIKKYKKKELFNFDFECIDEFFNDAELVKQTVYKIVNVLLKTLDMKLIKTKTGGYYITNEE